MNKTVTYTGKIISFLPGKLKTFPSAEQAKAIIEQHSFRMRFNPEQDFNKTITIQPKTLMALANFLDDTEHLALKAGMTLTIKCRAENGLYLQSIKTVNGHEFHALVVKARKLQTKKIKHQAAVKARKASQAAQAKERAQQKSLAESKASSVSKSAADSKKASQASSRAALASSARASQSVSVSVSASKSASASSASAQSLAKRALRGAGQKSMSTLSKRLASIGDYHNLVDNPGIMAEAKKIYQSLVSQPATKMDAGLKRALASENWHGFVTDMDVSSGKDFNRSLNQQITNYRMNYGLIANHIPNDLDKRRHAHKKKNHHKLHDTNVF